MKNISEIAINVTTKAAAACYKWIGKHESKLADLEAVTAMEQAFSEASINGKVVIGEGERDEAPMLYIGQELGNKEGESIDIAVDPLEGTDLCAKNLPGALTVLALGPKGTILQAPDVYMEKIIYNKNYPHNLLNLDDSVESNLQKLANYKKCALSEIKVITLDRERHQFIIDTVKKLGANLTLIQDGDISAAILTSLHKENYYDVYIGTGGAPEGVLAAAALKVIGGNMQARLLFKNQHEIDKATKLGITDLNYIYNINDMIKSNIVFCASGVTNGPLLEGAIYNKQNNDFTLKSLLIDSSDNSVNIITSNFKYKLT